jgi:hypothetical protein
MAFGCVFNNVDRSTDIRRPLTPEEIRESVKAEVTMWGLLLPAMFALIGLFSLFAGIIEKSVWGHIIGFVLILFSFLFTIGIDDNSADIHGEVIRKAGGAIISFLFLVPAFLFILSFLSFIVGAILYLLGFILAFRVSKIYGIISAVIFLSLHILALLD